MLENVETSFDDHGCPPQSARKSGRPLLFRPDAGQNPVARQRRIAAGLPREPWKRFRRKVRKVSPNQLRSISRARKTGPCRRGNFTMVLRERAQTERRRHLRLE